MPLRFAATRLGHTNTTAIQQTGSSVVGGGSFGAGAEVVASIDGFMTTRAVVLIPAVTVTQIGQTRALSQIMNDRITSLTVYSS